MLLLLLIMASFPAINALLQRSFSQINILENEIALVDTQLQSYAPTVNNFNRVSSLLSQIQDQLVLMNTLSENSITWSVNLNLINSGVDEIGGVWLQAITPGDTPNTLNIQGIARDRNRVSAVAELFADATLLDVTRSLIRDVEVYNFSYYVNKIVEDTEVYTPQNLQGLGTLPENNVVRYTKYYHSTCNPVLNSGNWIFIFKLFPRVETRRFAEQLSFEAK